MFKYDPGLQQGREDCLCLHRNENLFVGRDWVVDAAAGLVEEAALQSYPDPACQRLREGIAKMFGVEPENIFVGNGADEVLAVLFAVLRERYDTVHLLDVGFKVYQMLAHRHRYRVATLPGDTFETGRVEARGWGGLAVIDSPNAITAGRLPAGQIERLAEHANSFVVWDNVYGELAGDRMPARVRDNVVVVRSFSKFYGLAGLRIGYCVASRDMVERLSAAKDVFSVNGMAQVMALEALRRRGEFETIAARIGPCRTALVRELTHFGFRVRDSAVNFILVTHPDYAADFLQAELLERKVTVRRFADPPIGNHLRITVPPPAGLEQVQGALRDIFGQRPGAGR